MRAGRCGKVLQYPTIARHILSVVRPTRRRTVPVSNRQKVWRPDSFVVNAVSATVRMATRCPVCSPWGPPSGWGDRLARCSMRHTEVMDPFDRH